MLRSVAVAIVLLGAAGAPLAPCQAREDVRFWHSLTGAQAQEIERVAARFNAAQREYRVVPSYRGTLEAAFARALAVRRTAAAPHIVQIHEALTDDLIAEQLVVPLWRVLADAREPFVATLLPTVTGAFSDERGRLLALPLTSSTPVLYYNRDALRRAGLPGAAPATWYEMPAVLEALAASGSSCPFTTASPSWTLLQNLSAWHNQEFVTQDNGIEGEGTRLAFNSRLLVRWTAMLSTWRKSGYFVFAGSGGAAEERFLAGECVFLTASSASYPALHERAGFDLGVARLPYYDDFDDAPQNTLAAGAALWVLAGKARQAYHGTAKFLAFLARPDVQAEWQWRTGFVPFTMQAYLLARSRGNYLKQPGQEIALRQLADKLPTEDSRAIRFADLRRIRGIIDEELDAVWLGAKAPLEALNAAVERGNVLLSTGKH